MTLQFELVRATLILEVLAFALFSLPFIPSRMYYSQFKLP
jgi:hypothetical protein